MAARVLCVDDERDFVDALVERLGLRGYRAQARYDGESALELVRGEPFDVLVLDVLMPGRTGLELIEDFLAARPEMQILLLTGQGSVESAVTGMKLGAADYLQKPVDITALDRAIRHSLSRKSGIEQSRRMMETARLAGLGSLARGVAHEINNPVNIMVNNAGWIMELIEDQQPGACKDAEEIMTSARHIHDHGLRCKNITLGLLKFCGVLDTRKRDVKPGEALEGALERLSEKAGRLGVAIRPDIVDDLPTVRMSPAEIDEVLYVLLDNALDAMEARGGEILVRMGREGESLRIEVEDFGVGISEENLAHVFDPFFSTKDPGKGTGLGLAICRRIVADLGGEITGESRPGQGSVFRVLLPAAQTGRSPGSES